MEDFYLLQLATEFSARHHRQQVRFNDTPYVIHPFRVCLTLSHLFGIDDAETLSAALLHGLIERTLVDYDEIAEEFGSAVARLVAEMSKDMRLPEDERETAYDERIREGSWKVQAINLADAYDVLWDAPEKTVSQAMEKANRAIACAGDDERLAKGIDLLRILVEDAPHRIVAQRLWQQALDEMGGKIGPDDVLPFFDEPETEDGEEAKPE